MASAEISRLKNTGLTERQILDRINAGMTDAQAEKEIRARESRPQSQRHLLCPRPWPQTALMPAVFPATSEARLSLLLLPISPATIESLWCHARIPARFFVSFSRPLVFGSPPAPWRWGPGYSIEKQEIRVQFLPGPDPRIRVDSDYQLRNTGNQPLSSLELRLAGRRSFRVAAAQATWDGAALAEQNSLWQSTQHLR